LVELTALKRLHSDEDGLHGFAGRGDVRCDLDDPFDLAPIIANRTIGRLNPDFVPRFGDARIARREALTRPEIGPEPVVFGTIGDFGSAKNPMMAALNLGKVVADGSTKASLASKIVPSGRN
jgi:hypothetical protein